MNRLFALLTLLAAIGAPLSATNYFFTNSTYTLSDSGGTEFSAGNLQLGKFTAGFAPSSSNLNAWSASWLSGPTGEYDPSGPDWSAALTQTDNSVYAVGDQLYLWAYNTISGSNREWALLSDPAWKVIVNSNLNLVDQFLDFTPATTALFGSIADGRITTANASAVAPVPEPATWISMLTGCVMILGVSYRRHLRSRAA